MDTVHVWLKIIVIIMLAGCGGSGSASGTQRTLNPTPTGGRTIRIGGFATVNAALQSARAGDTVLLDSKTYRLPQNGFTVPITVPVGVTLAGTTQSIISTDWDPGTSPVIILNDGASIRNVHIMSMGQSERYAIVSTGTTNVTVDGCRTQTRGGVRLTNVTNGVIRSTVIIGANAALSWVRTVDTGVELNQCSNVMITRNTIVEEYTGMRIVLSPSTAITENIVSRSSDGILINPTVPREIIAYNIYGDVASPYSPVTSGLFVPTPGTNEYIGKPGFVDVDRDYRIAPNSRARTNGPTGGLIGALPAVDYQSILTLNLDPSSPSGTSLAWSNGGTVLLIFRASATGAPATLSKCRVTVWSSGMAVWTTLLTGIHEAGNQVATARWVASGTFDLESSGLTIVPGTPRVFAIIGDSSLLPLGSGTFQVTIDKVWWNDGVIDINNETTPIGLPLKGNSVTF